MAKLLGTIWVKFDPGNEDPKSVLRTIAGTIEDEGRDIALSYNVEVDAIDFEEDPDEEDFDN